MLCSFLKSAISIWSSQINFRPVYVCWFFESAISIRFSDNLGGGFMSSRILKFAISLVLKYHFTCYLILKSAISIQFSETLPEELHILFLKLLKQESMSLFGSWKNSATISCSVLFSVYVSGPRHTESAWRRRAASTIKFSKFTTPLRCFLSAFSKNLDWGWCLCPVLKRKQGIVMFCPFPRTIFLYISSLCLFFKIPTYGVSVAVHLCPVFLKNDRTLLCSLSDFSQELVSEANVSVWSSNKRSQKPCSVVLSNPPSLNSFSFWLLLKSPQGGMHGRAERYICRVDSKPIWPLLCSLSAFS